MINEFQEKVINMNLKSVNCILKDVNIYNEHRTKDTYDAIMKIGIGSLNIFVRIEDLSKKNLDVEEIIQEVEKQSLYILNKNNNIEQAKQFIKQQLVNKYINELGDRFQIDTEIFYRTANNFLYGYNNKASLINALEAFDSNMLVESETRNIYNLY